MERLDPKLDVTFKLLFSRHPELLRHMLEAVLGKAIASIEVLNPAVPGDLVGEKNIELDLRVRLATGERVDIEMQIRFDGSLADRFVYYAAREHAGQLARGSEYRDLDATIVVIWMVAPLFPELEQYHSIFELRERRTQWLFSEKVAIHLLQLAYIDVPSAEPSPHAAAIRRWGRFLLATNDAELNALENEDPIMSNARTALDDLSQDPEAARAARYRADELKLNQIALAHARLETQRKAILSVLSVRGLAVSDEAKTRISAERDMAALERWLVRAAIASSTDELFQDGS